MSIASNALTIVIPAKNESRLLPNLLESLCRQDYPLLRSTRVFVADAGSTDGTQQIARSYSNALAIEVIPGGLPSVGRNAGARRAESRYVLFIDADMELKDPTLLRRALALAERRRLYCVTTNIWCSSGGLRDHLLYLGNNIIQYASVLASPFSTGMFMLFEKAAFDRLGGFHKNALYAEDYLLSKKVALWRFGIVRGRAQTTNRRFRNMGYFKIVRLFAKTMFNSWNESYFMHDQGYWEQKV
jgi:glycosyltransferase involved in cell wall biosynthesis